jgi:hypothetical protein
MACLKAGHKIYLPLLHVWSHCYLLATKKRLKLCDVKITKDSKELVFLKEGVSDIGNGFFCCFHGAYKPAHMALRSGIENFMRFIAGAFDSGAITTTSIFELFDIAKSTPPFGGTNAKYHGQLRSIYTALCKYSHSASLDHMSGVHALRHFPTFDIEAFKTWTEYASEASRAMTSILLFSDPDIYLKAHFLTQEVFDLLIPAHVRKRLLQRHR